jgi:hypothetical protein
MQPLDRGNAQVRREAAVMRTATLQQRSENDEQRARMHALREANRALRRRVHPDGAAGTWAWTSD